MSVRTTDPISAGAPLEVFTSEALATMRRTAAKITGLVGRAFAAAETEGIDPPEREQWGDMLFLVLWLERATAAEGDRRNIAAIIASDCGASRTGRDEEQA